MSGNEAFARGIFEAGVRFTANYPGTPLSEVGDYLAFLSKQSKNFTFDYSLNEKVALESCVGASWAGVRSVVMFKHLGLNVAADPLHSLPYSGVNGGMLILCGGDPGILSSTNAQDNRLYSLHTKIPIIEPSSVQECKDFIKEGLRISELYKIPIYVHVTTRLCHSFGIVTYGEIESPKESGYFEKNPSRFINTLWKAKANQAKYFNIVGELAKSKKGFYLFNKINELITDKSEEVGRVGILTSGICYSYVVQACHKLEINAVIFKLGLIFPINREEICVLANKYNLSKLLVVEELEPFIEVYVKSVFCNFCDAKQDLEVFGKDEMSRIGELSTDSIMRFLSRHFEVSNSHLLEEFNEKEKALVDILPTLPVREPTFCPGCQYRPVFYALKNVTEEISKEKGIEFIFAGDIGCYTLAEAYPYQLIDWVICMGAGIGISNGMAQIVDPTKQKLIAYVGDSTFFHTGIQPLLNAIKNDIDLTVLLFNNYWTAMTGHQEHVATPSEIKQKKGNGSKLGSNPINLIKFVESLGLHDLTITDAYNLSKLSRIFSSTLMKDGVKLIVINEECALKKRRRLRNQAKEQNSSQKAEVYYTISDSCVKCNECIEKLGCPAINARLLEKDTKDSKHPELLYYIDESRCMPNICPGVCKSVCKNNAIHKTIITKKDARKVD